MFQDAMSWQYDWIIGVALSVLTLTLHIGALTGIYRLFETRLAHFEKRQRRAVLAVPFIFSPTLILILSLHGAAAMLWGVIYVAVGALPDARRSMLYSLNAMTSYGHVPFDLAPDWQLLGAIQALCGMLSFGMTIAFLAGVSRRMWTNAPF